VFPGDRRVWKVAGLVAAAGLVVIIVALLWPRDYFTGTNSIRSRGFPTFLDPGQRLCVKNLDIPAGTERVQIEVYNADHPLPALDGEVEAGGRRLGATHVPGRPRPGSRKVAFDIPERPDQPEATTGTLCVRTAGNVAVGGMAELQTGDVAPTIDGEPGKHRVAVWYLPPEGDKRTLLGQLPTIFERAALFRPGVVGPWTYWVILLAWMPLVAYAGLRVLARAGERPPRRTAIALVAVTVANGWAWALLTPPFDSPDESEHFAYVQYFAETGHRVARHPRRDRSTHSAEQQHALDALRLFSYTERRDGRPPWLERNERRWAERLAREPRPPPQDTGGGNAIATQLNDPLYYGSLAPAYLVAQGGSSWTQLTAARLLTVLYGAIVVLCAFAVVRELLPTRPWAAAAAGLLLAFQPMFAFISSSVNNDGGVNAMAALAVYLTVRALRRGLTPRLGAALALTLVALPVMKPTGYSLYPIVLLALAALLWKRHSRADLRAYAALAATFAVAFAGWELLAPAFDQPPSPVALPANEVPITGVPGKDHPRGYASYLWQVFLPPLPFMDDLFVPRLPFYDIYVKTGFAAFGWYQVLFPEWVYLTIVAAMLAAAAGGVLAVRRHREWARRHWMELAFLVLVPFVVLAAVEAAFYTSVPRHRTAEFGRYEFPAMAALAALPVGACFAFGRRRAPLIAAGVVAAMIVFDYAAQLVALAGYYT